MGQRGIGAKPIPRRPKTSAKAKKTAQPWEKRGLSRVERVCAFIESLPITSGVHAGRKFRLRDWQKAFLSKVYAVDATEVRLVRTAVLSMGRKNGKSQLAAALALCHLAGPEAEQRGQVYSAANDRKQAALIFSEMAAMIERVPFLDERLSLKRFGKEIENMVDGSVFAALSADASTKHGLSPSFVVCDELGQAPNRHLFDALDTATGARAEPLTLIISTQAPGDLHVMSELIDYGLRVQAGDIVDCSFHLTLYTAPAELDPYSLQAWRAANPALGDFRSLPDVERMAAQAQRVPSKAGAFENLILNRRVAAETRFLSLAEWRLCGEPGRSDEELAGQECWGGLDLGASRDLTSLVLIFPAPDGTIDVRAWFFLPADGLEDREDRDRVPYAVWRDRGLLTLTAGTVTDPTFVAALIAELRDTYEIRGIAYDRWRIEALKRALADAGIEDGLLVPFGQGFKDFAPAVDALERAVAERKLRHGGNPILTWNVGNAVATRDPTGAAKLDKSRSTGRIDGLVALTMALGLRAKTPAVEEVSDDLDITWL